MALGAPAEGSFGGSGSPRHRVVFAMMPLMHDRKYIPCINKISG